ncbi:hypothetical protein HDU76_000275 [Blyttiomyces sp. JEL0837]|nr:hypothetical protein HDU76_000275 [Blyttiomyces sp. JEL0837]
MIERNAVTNASRVRIVFRYQSDADRFYATVNGSMFLGARVQLAFQDPEMNFSNTSGSKIIVAKHIPLGVTSLDFYDFVRPHGKIMSCKVLIDRVGTESYALLQFESQDDADRCLEKVNGLEFRGSTIAMSWQFQKNAPYVYPQAVSPQPGLRSGSPNTSRPQWTQPSPPPTPPSSQRRESNAERPSSSTGWYQPSPAVLSDGKSSPAPNSSSNDIVHAWETPSDQPLSTASLAGLDSRNLYVKNLDDSIDNLELFNMFRVFGRIVSAKVMRDDVSGKSKGFGFVSFETEAMSVAALESMNGKKVGAKNLVVNVAEPKGFRERKLQAVYAGSGRG